MVNRHAELPLWSDRTLDEKLDTLRLLINDLYVYHFSESHKKILHILDEHSPADEKEEEDVTKMKQAILSYPNILNKNCEFGHFIGSGLIVDVISGRYLLHYHKSLGMILQFGGHAEYELNLEDVALREAKEESGLTDLVFLPSKTNPRPLDIDMHIIPRIGNRPEHYHLDFRYLLGTEMPDRVCINPGESTKLLWLSYEQAMSHKFPLQEQLIRLITKANKIYQNS